MNTLTPLYKPICSAITALLPGTEVVLHDLSTGSIAHIENPLSARKAGDESLIDQEELANIREDNTIIGPYIKTHFNGSEIKTVSAILRDNKGQAIALLCINMMLDDIRKAQKLLADLTSFAESADTQALIHQDWRETANQIIKDTLNEYQISLASAKKLEKIGIIGALDQAGIFETRGSSNYIAEAMGISRANLYQLLNASRHKQ